MPMFKWSSDRFADYYDGHIIVCAANVESARKKAIKAYKANYVHDKPNEREFKEFLKDVGREPSVDDVIFIYGGG